jgi:predicted  nucleic acid-binding Zn-ribbon protein
MKKLILVIGVFSLVFMNSCVERSAKYKTLQARLDSVQVASNAQAGEIETLMAGINELNQGMQTLREIEQLLVLESSPDQKGNTQSKIIALKNDLHSLSEAIASYKEQINKLETSNKRQSAEFRKLLASLKAELEQKEARINDLSAQLEAKEKELGLRQEEIVVLNKNVSNLEQETRTQKETISVQDLDIHKGHYLLDTKKNLKAKHLITRNGLFSPLTVTEQIVNAQFTDVDVRQLKSIPLNSPKAKVLSLHPTGSYTLSAGADKNLILTITNADSFWKQTKYLVVVI